MKDGLRENLIISHFSVNRDYLPIRSLSKQFGYVSDRQDKVYILEGYGNITEESKEGLHLRFTIKNASQHAALELPYFFYPGFTVILDTDTEKVPLETFESENGFLSVRLPNDITEAKITVDYTGTTLETIAYIISAISLIGFIVYIIQFRKKSKETEE